MKTLYMATLLALCAAPALASTSDILSSRRADYFAPGRHQFYAWCADGQDRILRERATSATQARDLLAVPGCILRWQGRAP